MGSIDDIIKASIKKHKTQLINKGLEYEPLKRFDFSSPTANIPLRGGVPRARLIEFAGENSSGKTTSGLDVVANAQIVLEEEFEQTGKKREILYVDVENSLDYTWARKLNVDTDDMIYYRPEIESAEEILQTTRELIETGEFALVIFDSIGALVTEARLGKSIDEKTYCGVAGPFTDFVNIINKYTKRFDMTFIGINQVKPVIGSPFPAWTYKGGETWKYLCSVRLLFTKNEFIDEDGKKVKKSYVSPQGNMIGITLNKASITPPDRRESYYSINYHEGVDVIGDSVNYAITQKIITQSGSYYYYNDNSFQGFPKLKQYFKENNDDFEGLHQQLMQLAKS
jgi:recombination protein RecA